MKKKSDRASFKTQVILALEGAVFLIFFASKVFCANNELKLTNEGISKPSLFTPKLSWKNDQGQITELSKLKGKPIVLAMMYTSCQSSCPLIIQKIRKIETLFDKNHRQASFVLVTFDPKRDTPDNLSKYRKKIGLSGPKNAHWHFLTGSIHDTRTLSMLLGLKFSRDPDSGEILHDNRIYLISDSGVILENLQSLGDDESIFLK